MRSEHAKAIVKAVELVGRRHSTWRVFSDFGEMAAISISNAVDWAQRNPREERYLAIAKQYDAEELACFPKMLVTLTEALGEGFDDVLGRVFHDLELHNKWHGQFFSPYSLCRMIADITVDNPAERIAARGFITVHEPACGAGAMIIAIADSLKAAGINYQDSLHVVAVDVDPKCVHMAYLQLSLLGIPAVVVQGNSLTLEETGRWYTPMHILGNWTWRLRKRAEPAAPEPIVLPAVAQGDLFGAAA